MVPSVRRRRFAQRGLPTRPGSHSWQVAAPKLEPRAAGFRAGVPNARPLPPPPPRAPHCGQAGRRQAAFCSAVTAGPDAGCSRRGPTGRSGSPGLPPGSEEQAPCRSPRLGTRFSASAEGVRPLGGRSRVPDAQAPPAKFRCWDLQATRVIRVLYHFPAASHVPRAVTSHSGAGRMRGWHRGEGWMDSWGGGRWGNPQPSPPTRGLTEQSCLGLATPLLPWDLHRALGITGRRFQTNTQGRPPVHTPPMGHLAERLAPVISGARPGGVHGH